MTPRGDWVPGKHHQIILALHNRRTKRASSNDGMVRPSALAAVQLITSFYLLGACTGRFGSKAKPRPLLQQLTESRLTGRSENVPQHDPPIHFLARCPSCRSPAILPLRPSCVVCALVGSLFADRGRCCQLAQGRRDKSTCPHGRPVHFSTRGRFRLANQRLSFACMRLKEKPGWRRIGRQSKMLQ